MTKRGIEITIGLVCMLIMLGGCSTIEGATGMTFDNRIACSVAGDAAFVVSQYGGRIGISSPVSELDRPYICGVR